MKIAVLLFTMEIPGSNGSVRRALLFETNREVIRAVGEDYLSTHNVDYVVLWLISKNVQEVFADELPDRLHDLLGKIGIRIRSLDDIKKNPLLDALLVKDPVD